MAKTFKVQLPSELTARLVQPVTGAGGWQSLLKDIQACLEAGEGGAALVMPSTLLERMIPYAIKFGSGGYQGIIRWIICLVVAEYQTLLIPVSAGTGVTLKPTAAQGE